jgi:hypothetical protein
MKRAVGLFSMRKEKVRMRGVHVFDIILADRRHGCRGGEVAKNLSRRKIPCC